MRAQYGRDIEDSDARLMEMLAAQAAHREVDSLSADEETIAADEKLTDDEKRDILQKSLNMAASNGDVERVRKLVQGQARTYVDVNKPDEEGTVPLIYASCFVSYCCAPSIVSRLIGYDRVIKMSLPPSLTPVLWSTGRIVTSGAL